MKHKNTAFLF